MARHVTEQDVRRIAAYTRIGLSDEELLRMTADLNAIIDGLQPITEYDLEGVEPTFHPIGELVNVTRADEARAGFTQGEALANAPQQHDGAFVIPSILGGEGPS